MSDGGVVASGDSSAAIGGDVGIRASSGGVAALRIDHLHLHQSPEQPFTHSAYAKQVERIAPVRLIGRETELAELAAFADADAGGDAGGDREGDAEVAPSSAYRWWRAPAWAGKSALMAWFVLHPPENVDVVSFFITARLASQADREAFIDVVLEQLATTLGRGLPPLLTPATREAHLLDMLDEAARSCADRGRRLVLLVDGLDEDRGVTTDPSAYSIAALLPARPRSGLRVIVAGRLNPPVPADVPAWHPLHDRAIVRMLSPSPAAEVVRNEAENDLQRLLQGTDTERDVLGLVAAARGGLAAADLVELTGASAYEARRTLHAVGGRSFVPRAGRRLEGESDLYILAHDRLQETALDVLGRTRLDSYRDRLHAWAERYRSRGWPDSTPEYLLQDYFGMLRYEGDLARMLACALDAARHDRMLAAYGADGTALAELATTHAAIAADPHPDLLAAVRLAAHRTVLTERNARLPAALPRVWAVLGEQSRAETLAYSLTDAGARASALTDLARLAAQAGQAERAVRFVRQAVESAHQIPFEHFEDAALARIAGVYARLDRFDDALDVVESMPVDVRSGGRIEAWAEIARPWVEGDRSEWPRALIEGLCDPSAYTTLGAMHTNTEAVGAALRALVLAGRPELAESRVRMIPTHTDRLSEMLAVLAEACARFGHPDLANRAGREVHGRALRETRAAAGYPYLIDELIPVLVRIGLAEDLEGLAPNWTRGGTMRSVTRAALLTALARGHADTGDPLRALGFAHEAARQAATLSGSSEYTATLRTDLVEVYAAAGERETAAELSRLVLEASSTPTRSRVWVETSGGRPTYNDILQPEPLWAPRIKARLSAAFRKGGLPDEAREVARAIIEPAARAEALAACAEALLRVGRVGDAVAAAHEAAATAQGAADPSDDALALLELAKTLVEQGEAQRAAEIAASAMWHADRIQNAYAKSYAVQKVSEYDQRTARAGDGPTLGKDAGLAARVGALAADGRFDEAAALVGTIVHPFMQSQAGADLAKVLDQAGQHARARQMLAQACALGPWRTVVRGLAAVDPGSLAAFADEVARDERARRQA